MKIIIALLLLISFAAHANNGSAKALNCSVNAIYVYTDRVEAVLGKCYERFSRCLNYDKVTTFKIKLDKDSVGFKDYYDIIVSARMNSKQMGILGNDASYNASTCTVNSISKLIL